MRSRKPQETEGDARGWVNMLFKILESRFQALTLDLSHALPQGDVTPIQHTEDTKDVPSGKGGWHRPVALEYARHWNMRCRSPPNLISRAM